MTHFIAIKTHYDHRKSLPTYLKFSRVATKNEYDEYLKLYYDEGIGGEGFHECLNFNIKEHENTKIYLPPGYMPRKKICNDDFIIFTFTYKGDKELPSHIIGVHAGASITNRDGTIRKEIQALQPNDFSDLTYHAESPPHLTTLFNSPIKYDCRKGKYTKKLQAWGNKLKYIGEKDDEDDNRHFALKIINEALKRANNLITTADEIKLLSIEREIEVLKSIKIKYLDGNNDGNKLNISNTNGGGITPPDKEIGYLGEKYIYERELKYVKNENLPLSLVEWVSQSIPSSVIDIKTVRKTKTGSYENHYLEIKSTKMSDYNNVYISSRQINFFKENPNDSTFVFVKFDNEQNVIGSDEFNLKKLKSKFSLKPIKFRLEEK